ncbi:ThiF family adenylyltransferase [Candidatus Acetothermia bacterium]|nr:ThiF family adenylyltransferase [Candidatus Acetothermia bacterium]
MKRELVITEQLLRQCVELSRRGTVYLVCRLCIGRDHVKFLAHRVARGPSEPWAFLLTNTTEEPRDMPVLQLSGNLRALFTSPLTGELDALDYVKVLGLPVRVFPTVDCRVEASASAVVREVEVLGPEYQPIRESYEVAFIGAGKTGFPGIDQICGRVKQIRVVDFDKVAEENVPFLRGAESWLGRSKVEFIAHAMYGRGSQIVPIAGDATTPQVLEQLKTVDHIFLTCDRVLPRLAITLLAAQYLIPVTNTGVLVERQHDRVVMQGVVETTVPGVGPCFYCSRGLDLRQAWLESMIPEERRMGTSQGVLPEQLPSRPAIGSFSRRISDTAITEFYNLYTAMKARVPRRLDVDDTGGQGYIRADFTWERDPNCPICNPTEGLLGLGDSEPIRGIGKGGVL